MILSKEDLFFDRAKIGEDGGVGDTLDFHSHGDDVLGSLFWFVHASGAATVAAIWQTSDTEDFTDVAEIAVETAATDAAGYAVRNAPLPKGLKRYNRLKLTVDGDAEITAGLTDGRDEGTPFKG